MHSGATLVFWHGSIVAADGDLTAIDPYPGHPPPARPRLFFTQLRAIGERLYFLARGTYERNDHPIPRCGQADDSTAVHSLTGTTTTLYVASGPVDVGATAAPQHIFACTAADKELPGFTPPAIPTRTKFIGGMAVVGTHLLVFTHTF
jgi:hypothetical protein